MLPNDPSRAPHATPLHDQTPVTPAGLASGQVPPGGVNAAAHVGHDSEANPIVASPPSSALFRAMLSVGLIVVVAGLAVIGILPRMQERRALAAAQDAKSAPRVVQTVTAKPASEKVTVQLPASVIAHQTTTLYAKAIGFVRSYSVDVGDRVKTGQILAEIDAPENAEAVHLAAVKLDEAQANVGLAQAIADRNQKLANAGLATQEQVESTKAQANTAQAAVRTSHAELAKANALYMYQRIIAPFDGLVTKRSVDRGALVGNGGSATPLFEIAQTDILRAIVDVPQWLSSDIHIGDTADVYMLSSPNDVVAGKIARTSGVLDPSTRTLRAEVEIPGGGRILPGAFLFVRFTSIRSKVPIVIPQSALIVRKEGTGVLRITSGKVEVVPIIISRDLGKDIEVVSGLAGGDTLIVNGGDDLETGMAVTEFHPPTTAATSKDAAR